MIRHLCYLTLMACALTAPLSHALLIQCRVHDGRMPDGPTITTSFETESGVFWQGDAEKESANQKTVPGSYLKPGTTPRTLNILSPRGRQLATLELLGHALRPTIRLVVDDGPPHDCQLSYGDAEELFEKLITDPDQLKTLWAWNDWKKKRSKVCDPYFDSIGYFQPSSKIAVVLHGVASQPRAMEPVIRQLLDAGYSVLAPRLTGHYNVDIHDLDNAKYTDWIKDSENVFRIARQYNRHAQITVAGFSMGGFLATRLGFRYPSRIDRLMLFAPAWFVSPAASAGALVGTLFLHNISLNSFMHIPEACKNGDGYMPSKAGLQVTNMTLSVPQLELKGREVTELRMPYLLVTSDKDEATSPELDLDICKRYELICNSVRVHGVGHTELMDQLSMTVDLPTGDHTINDFVTNFLAKSVNDLITDQRHIIDHQEL